MSFQVIFRSLKAAFWRWLGDNTFQLGAALAYYTVFSLAPLVLIALAITGLFFGENAGREELLKHINDTMGSQVGHAIESIVQYHLKTGNGHIATLIGFVVLFFGATSVFAQMQAALNTIWGVKSKKGTGWLRTIRNRFWSFTVVLGIGFLLLASLIITALLAACAQVLDPTALPGGTYAWQLANWVISFVLVTLFFALIYKLLPDVEIKWADVWIGAVVTAMLFALGKYLIGLYLSQGVSMSAYGAAGSIMVILLWVYYSSQIFLFGAEFTYVFAKRSGTSLTPKRFAEMANDTIR